MDGNRTLSKENPTHEDPLRQLYRIVSDPASPQYRYPVQEIILGYGQMDATHREALIAEARGVGLNDAKSGALCNDVVVAANLEEILGAIPEGMERVAGHREDIEAHVQGWNRKLRDAADESRERTSDPDYKRELDEARYGRGAALADVKALGTSGKHVRALLLIGVFVAVAGILVDAVLLGAAVEATEDYSTSASFVLGFLIALLLGGVSVLAGWLYGKGRPGGRIAKDLVPPSMEQTHNNNEHDRAKELRTWRIVSWVVVGIVASVIVALVGLRLSEWLTETGTPASTTGGLFGSPDTADGRSSRIWVQAAIILIAIVSLVIFWYEGYQFALMKRRVEADRRVMEYEAELDALKSEAQMEKAFSQRADENEKDLEHLDEDIARAVQSLQPLWLNVIDAYRGSAINWLQGPKVDERLKAQIPVFAGIEHSVRPLGDLVSPTVAAILKSGAPSGASGGAQTGATP